MYLMNFLPFSMFGHLLLSCAKHKFRTMYANVWKFHIWIPNEEIGDPYVFFLSELSPILESFNEITLQSR